VERKEKLTFPDIGIVRRGGEGSVKGPDRVSGGVAALDSARASATLLLSVECQWGLSSGIPGPKIIPLP